MWILPVKTCHRLYEHGILRGDKQTPHAHYGGSRLRFYFRIRLFFCQEAFLIFQLLSLLRRDVGGLQLEDNRSESIVTAADGHAGLTAPVIVKEPFPASAVGQGKDVPPEGRVVKGLERLFHRPKRAVFPVRIQSLATKRSSPSTRSKHTPTARLVYSLPFSSTWWR